MQDEATLSISSKAISLFLEPTVKALFKTINIEVKNAFQNRLIEYTAETAKKCFYVKTILHKEKIALNRIYFPLNLSSGKGIINPSSVKNIFKNDNKIVIVGKGGSGKTTLIKYLYMDCVRQNFKIPVLLNLRDFNGMDIEDMLKEKDKNRKNIFFSWVVDHLLFNAVAIEVDLITRMFAEGAFLFILDGYDELSYEIKSHVLKDIESFIVRFSKNLYLITSRPHTDATRISDFTIYDICGLDQKKDMEKFIHLQLFNDNDLAQSIVDALSKPASKKYAPLLSNPLFLTLFINSFESYPKLPPKKSTFYWQVFDALYEKHETYSKSGYKRPKLSKLSREDFEYILNVLCFISYFQERFEFDKIYLEKVLREIRKTKRKSFEPGDFVEDLKVAVSLLVEDGGVLFFVHRTLQEYFAARFLENFVDKEVKDFLKHLAQKQVDHSSHTFLIELISELYEKEFVQYYIMEHLRAFIKKHGRNVKDNHLSAYLLEEALDSYENLIEIISFSKEIENKFNGLLKKHQANYNRSFEPLTTIAQDSLDMLLSLLVLERNWFEIETGLTDYMKQLQLVNKPFIEFAFNRNVY